MEYIGLVVIVYLFQKIASILTCISFALKDQDRHFTRRNVKTVSALFNRFHFTILQILHWEKTKTKERKKTKTKYTKLTESKYMLM